MSKISGYTIIAGGAVSIVAYLFYNKLKEEEKSRRKNLIEQGITFNSEGKMKRPDLYDEAEAEAEADRLKAETDRLKAEADHLQFEFDKYDTILNNIEEEQSALHKNNAKLKNTNSELKKLVSYNKDSLKTSATTPRRSSKNSSKKGGKSKKHKQKTTIKNYKK